MAVYGKIPIPSDLMKKVKPPTGFPVSNMGGIPKQPVVAPKPAVKPLGLAAGPPGPAPMTSSFMSTDPSQHSTEPAPAPAPTTPSLTSDPSQYSVNSAPAEATAAPDPLEGQISDAISKMMGGGGGAWDAAAISRAKAGAKSAAEGQRRATVDMGNEDLAMRGMGRSGLGARMASDAARGAGASYTQAVADMMNQKAAADQQARDTGLQAALGLYQTKTGNQLARDQIAASHSGGGPQMFDYQDPETGEVYSLPVSMLG